MLYEKKIQKKGFDAFEKFKTRTGTKRHPGQNLRCFLVKTTSGEMRDYRTSGSERCFIRNSISITGREDIIDFVCDSAGDYTNREHYGSLAMQAFLQLNEIDQEILRLKRIEGGLTFGQIRCIYFPNYKDRSVNQTLSKGH